MSDNGSLIDLSRACFVAVGPSRIAACALTVLCDDDPTRTDTRHRYAAAQDRITAALVMLDKTFPKQIIAADFKISPNLDALRHKAFQCLKQLADALQGPLSELEGKMGGRVAFRTFFFDTLEPDVSAFLEAMTRELAEAEQARRAAETAKTLQSIDNASGVGRAIAMIAVNASIEASRSGDPGFRVIADEIKSLAAQTQHLLGEVGNAMRRT